MATLEGPVGYIMIGFGLSWSSRFLPIFLAYTAKKAGVSPKDVQEYESASEGDEVEESD